MDKNNALLLVKFHKEKNDAIFRDTFHNWLYDNWHIYEAFSSEADDVWMLGYRHYGGRRITEYLRHDTAKKQLDTTYKICDHATPDMVRLYVLIHPKRVDAFKYNRQDDFKFYVEQCKKDGIL